MKILVTTSSFSATGFPENWEIISNPYKRKLTEEEILHLILVHQPLGMIAGVEPLTQKVLRSAENLKVISRCGVGMDNVDLKVAGELGIQVRNTPRAPVISVAEFALSLILALSRKLIEIDTSVKTGGWNKSGGCLVHGKTVGIIGCGRIGSHLSGILQAMGCRLIGYDPYIKKHEICEMTDLKTIWEQADIISLHVPYTSETSHFVGHDELVKMKKNCLLVNTARGGLIDETALYNALQQGEIAGAALDVFEEEPYKGPLCSLGEKIILTAHAASSAREARVIMEKEALDNLIAGLLSV